MIINTIVYFLFEIHYICIYLSLERNVEYYTRISIFKWGVCVGGWLKSSRSNLYTKNWSNDQTFYFYLFIYFKGFLVSLKIFKHLLVSTKCSLYFRQWFNKPMSSSRVITIWPFFFWCLLYLKTFYEFLTNSFIQSSNLVRKPSKELDTLDLRF